LTERTSEREEFTASAIPADLVAQENRFLALLEAGILWHRRAQSYLHAALVTERHCESDWVLSAVGANPTAYLWRTQLFRYVSALAHYIPGVEVECLPLPHIPSPKLDYLYTALSGEAYYALSAVRAFGIHPAWDEALWEVGQIQANPGTRLAEDCARLAGWARFVRETAAAHVDFLDACLVDYPARLAARPVTRRTRNQYRIFCLWWNLRGFLASPDKLTRISAEFHRGRRAEAIPEFDSFFRFSQRIQQNFHDGRGHN
jgi:hypothetical protein